MGREMICPTSATANTTTNRMPTGRQRLLTNRTHSFSFSAGVRTTLSLGAPDSKNTQIT